jgi:hypothetical protein
MLGETQAYANTPYQVYGGPMTAGQSDLQSKVFQGLGGLNFPSNLGASFSSSGAYQPPQMNMGAYNPSPIGVGTPRPTYGQYMDNMNPEQRGSAVPENIFNAGLAGNDVYNQPLNQGSNGFGDFGSMPNNEERYAGGIPLSAGYQQPGRTYTYEDYASSPTQEVKMSREQFDAQQNRLNQQRQQGMDMLGRGNMSEIMAGLGGQPGQMPQGGLAGLLGRMPQQPQQPQNIAQQYMNPYLQSVLTPQLEELRRQNDITNMNTNAKFTGAGAYGGGRQAIMNAENNRNLMQEMNKTVGTGYANAYDKAMGQFNTEQGQSKTLADMMAGAGAAQRGIEQEGITADYNEFLNQRDYPQKMLQFKQSMLQGLPIATTTNQAAPMSGIGQLTSTIGGMGNIMESLKKFNLVP